MKKKRKPNKCLQKCSQEILFLKPLNQPHFGGKASQSENPHKPKTVKVSQKLITSSNGSTNCEDSKSGLRRSPSLNSASSTLSTNYVNPTSGLLKSSRLNSGSLSNKPEERSFFFFETRRTSLGKRRVLTGNCWMKRKGKWSERKGKSLVWKLFQWKGECVKEMKLLGFRGRGSRMWKLMEMFKDGQGNKHWLCKEPIFQQSQHPISGRRFPNWCQENLHRIALIRSTLTI